LRPGRPWPGRGEKGTPNRRGVLARASVPVLGAGYARAARAVQVALPGPTTAPALLATVAVNR
jgi:hypothetical protein